MSAVKVGLLIASVLAGPRLWGLVDSGDMSMSAAFERAGVVAAACVFGAVAIDRLIDHYALEQARARRVARALAPLDELVHEGHPVPPADGQQVPPE